MKKRKVKLFASIASLGLVVAVMGVGVWAATQQAVKVSSQVSFTATSVAADIKLSVNNAVAPAGAEAGEAAKYAAGKEYDIVKEATLSYDYQTKNTGNPTDGFYKKSEDLKDFLYSEQKIKETVNEQTRIPTYAYVDDSETPVDEAKDADPVGYGADRAQSRMIAHFTNDTAKTLYDNRVYLNLADKDEDGYLNIGAKVVYTFTIEASELSAPIYYNVFANLSSAAIFTPDAYGGTGNLAPVTIQQAFSVTITDTTFNTLTKTATRAETATISNWIQDTTDDTNKTPTNESKGYVIEPGTTRIITVVYEVIDVPEVTGYQGISYTMKSLELGDIYIRLANNGKNIEGLPAFSTNLDANDAFDKLVNWNTPKTGNPEGTEIGGDPEEDTGDPDDNQ